MKTLNLYEVTYESASGIHSFNVAAITAAKAKKQTKEYYFTATRIISAKRLGNVNVPLLIPAGL